MNIIQFSLAVHLNFNADQEDDIHESLKVVSMLNKTINRVIQMIGYIGSVH